VGFAGSSGSLTLSNALCPNPFPANPLDLINDVNIARKIMKRILVMAMLIAAAGCQSAVNP
jgi:hypothetical protein